MSIQALFRGGRPQMVDYTPDGSDVAGGDVVVINDLPLVAHAPIADGVLGALAAGFGIYRLTASAAIDECKKVYWKDSTNKLSESATDGVLFGMTLPGQIASADGDQVDVIHLPDMAASTPAAYVANLAGTLTGTVDGTMVDVAATAGSCAGGSSPSAANVDTAIATAVATIVTGVNTQNKELLTKINALLSALEDAGLMKTA